MKQEIFKNEEFFNDVCIDIMNGINREAVPDNCVVILKSDYNDLVRKANSYDLIIQHQGINPCLELDDVISTQGCNIEDGRTRH